jgi:hypothetical protein
MLHTVTKKFAIGLHETPFGWYATCTYLDSDPQYPSPIVSRGYTKGPQELLKDILPGVVFHKLRSTQKNILLPQWKKN